MKNTEVSVLNDVDKIREADPSNMYNRIFDLPEQMKDAVKIANGWNVSDADFPDFRNVVVLGMGGSAIGGDLVRAYLEDKILTPFAVCRDYKLPEYVDDETLVLASSYSGNTEETLSALDDALRRKAMVAAISTGGLLKDVADLNDIPMAILPEGLQPRAAIGYSFILTLMFFEKIGILKKVEPEINAMIERLQLRREKYIEDTPLISNPAKHLADEMRGRIPVIYGDSSITGVVAKRWKGQICENAKQMAFANEFPECCHNELMGWTEQVIRQHAERLIVVMLRDADDSPKIRKRMNIVKSIIERAEIPVHDVHSFGERPLERMFSLIQMGDFVSYYLAVLNEVDPTPVEAIETLKQKLAE